MVGGHSRNIGKTSVVEGLIRRFRQKKWTALKITQYGHGVCSHVGEACGCETEPEHPFALSEEYVAGPTDSGGFSRPARSGLSGCAPRWENWPDAFVVIDRGMNVLCGKPSPAVSGTTSPGLSLSRRTT